MRKWANISPCMRRPSDIYDFATAPFWISLYMRILFFISAPACWHIRFYWTYILLKRKRKVHTKVAFCARFKHYNVQWRNVKIFRKSKGLQKENGHIKWQNVCCTSVHLNLHIESLEIHMRTVRKHHPCKVAVFSFFSKRNSVLCCQALASFFWRFH